MLWLLTQPQDLCHGSRDISRTSTGSDLGGSPVNVCSRGCVTSWVMSRAVSMGNLSRWTPSHRLEGSATSQSSYGFAVLMADVGKIPSAPSFFFLECVPVGCLNLTLR